ncbi:MAG: hypothetical protein SGI83_17345 [Bacteroidota bacterium]|nr:hypothetical protein [Bacteroidota bacterium]
MTVKIKTSSSFKTALSAAKKLSVEEKQLLKLQLFAADALIELKAFETALKKSKNGLKKTDEEIVKLTTTIRRRNYAHAKKMLH